MLFASLVLTVICGCSNGQVPLSGSVTFEDGSPLTQGIVCFRQENYQAKGDIDSKGHYVLGAIHAKDGIKPGDYAVIILGANSTDDFGKKDILIDPKFEDPTKSGIVCKVEKGMRKFDITVQKPAAGK